MRFEQDYCMGMHKYADEVGALGTILGIWAHPDDEVFSSAGLMIRAVNNGQRVIIVTATRGDAGQTSDESRWHKKDLAEIRTVELQKSLEILGVKNHYWLNHIDGGLNEVGTSEAVERIIALINDQKVETVVSFEPQGITGHEDHKAVHRWSRLVAEKLNSQLLCAVENREFYESFGKDLHNEHNIYFNVEKPHIVACDDADLFIRLTESEQQKKFQALTAHASQTSRMLVSKQGIDTLNQLCKCECFVFDKHFEKS